MRRSLLALATTFTALSGQAFAMCMDGPPFACTINGKHGERQCIGGHITPCIADDPGPSTSGSATLQPKYFILTVVYAPPGTQGGSSTSSVSYGSGSTTGTTTSSTKTFKQSYSITATAGVGFLGNGGSVGVSFGYARNGTDTQSLAITKTKSTTIEDTGPSTDGVDHDHDLIYLWLNPTIKVTVNNQQAAWSISDGGTADIQYVYVGWLKDPSKMPTGVAHVLQHYGLTTEDYANILKVDPFADGPHPVSSRYVALNTTFPYEPPYSANDSVPTYNFMLSGNSTSTTTSSVENDYKVGLDIKTGASFIASASLENKDDWEWDNTSSKSDATGTNQSAAVTVGGPAFGYTGPTDMGVWYDRIYKTFMFRPVNTDQKPGLKGTLKDRNGKPVALKEITVVAHGTTYRTFTNARGEYRLYGDVSGPVTIRANGATQQLSKIELNKAIDLKM